MIKLAQKLALITVAIAPLYILRFKLWGLPTNPLEVAALITFFSAVIALLVERKKVQFGPIWPYLFLIIVLIAVLWSPDKQKALGIAKGWFTVPILLYWSVINLFSKENIEQLARPFTFSVSLVSVWAILQKFQIISTLFYQKNNGSFLQYIEQGRSFGPFESPNYLAMFVVPSLFIVVLLLKKSSSILEKASATIALSLGLVALVLSGSKGGLIALTAGMAVFISTLLIAKYKNWKFLKILLPVVGLTLIIFVFSRVDTNSAGNQIRREIYSYAKTMVIENPIRGVGLGNFQPAIDAITKDNPSFQLYGLPYALHPHNLFLAFWLNLGISGLLAFSALLIRQIAAAIKIENAWQRGALLAATSAFVIHGFFDTPYFKNDLSLIFWVIFGLTVTLGSGQIKTKIDFKKFLFYLFFLIIIFLPFQNIIGLSMQNFGLSGGLAFWLAHWYEPLVLICLIIMAVRLFYRKPVLSPVSILVLIIASLGIFSALAFSDSIGKGLEGFRFTLLPLLFLLLGLNFGLEDKKIAVIQKVYLVMAGLVAVIALAERLLPLNYWHAWGIVGANFGYGNFMAGSLQRSASILGGPNQLGSYLIPAFFLLLAQRRKVIDYLFLVMVTLAIVFSFSLAAALGLRAGVILFGLFYIKSMKIKLSLASLGALSIAGIFALSGRISAFREIILHGESQFWHMVAMRESIERFLSLDLPSKLYGIGLGNAGPLAVKYGIGIVSESWYLQLLLEIGIIGLLLWLAIAAISLINLYSLKQNGLFFALISLMITAVFLHTFADNPSIAITLFLLIGLVLGKDKHEENSN